MAAKKGSIPWNKGKSKYSSEEAKKQAARDRANQWYKENTDLCRERSSKQQKTEHGKKLRTAARNKHKKNNPEYWRHKKKIDKTTRRSREKAAGPLTKDTLVALETYNKEFFGSIVFTCEYCVREIGDNYHLEHLLCLSKGGSNEVSNLAVSCDDCNLKKTNKLLEEFAPNKVEYFRNRKL